MSIPAETPVRSLPQRTVVKLVPVAIRNQPKRQGTVAILIVFNRPKYSMMKPARTAPIGTTSTSALAAINHETNSAINDS